MVEKTRCTHSYIGQLWTKIGGNTCPILEPNLVKISLQKSIQSKKMWNNQIASTESLLCKGQGWPENWGRIRKKKKAATALLFSFSPFWHIRSGILLIVVLSQVFNYVLSALGTLRLSSQRVYRSNYSVSIGWEWESPAIVPWLFTFGHVTTVAHVWDPLPPSLLLWKDLLQKWSIGPYYKRKATKFWHSEKVRFNILVLLSFNKRLQQISFLAEGLDLLHNLPTS